ncbi:hypothetical protein AMTRI_Chr13g118940 [Amborella trichopoda]|uniref:RING-type domain-containing protein n=1 Tax=Amborella trichopoda TaxID=13333 RepID=W1NXJ0_AMBTC|nr:E3 ubiquitin-protein ligase RING1 [Amborella trichopoda]ERN00059.1 hypothetical protein AMTR_s00105p00089440 [Amborella trichopoda]|eukprot:XP_006837205.1 E3 ubiquitin-protein ligase RING1 [Amborella trichopoda]
MVRTLHTRNVLLDLVIRERTTFRGATVAHDRFQPFVKVSCSIIPACSTQELQTLDSTFFFILNEFQLMEIPSQIIHSLSLEIAYRTWILTDSLQGSGLEVHVVVDINGEREIVQVEEVETGYLEFLRIIEASQEDYPAKPVSKSVVEALKSADIGEQEEVTCAVCMSEIDSSDADTKVLPCSHRYHSSCIFKWFESRNSCPVCRYQLPTE